MRQEKDDGLSTRHSTAAKEHRVRVLQRHAPPSLLLQPLTQGALPVFELQLQQRFLSLKHPSPLPHTLIVNHSCCVS